jgi:hypothetical protein
MAAASAALVFHLSSVAVLALTYPSGPWPMSEGGADRVAPPRFAVTLFQTWPGEYVKAVQMARGFSYHFPTNRPGEPAVALAFRLRYDDGREAETVPLPDPRANFWVRHRQGLLAKALSMDLPVMPPQAERAPAPGAEPPSVPIWEVDKGARNRLVLRAIPEHEIPRDRPVFRPSDLSMVFARSYARHLCQSRGAAGAELVRYHQDPIPPGILFMDEPPPEAAFEKVQSNFGELPR